MNNKVKIIYIIAGVTLLIIYAIIAYVTLFPKEKTQPTPAVIIPTITGKKIQIPPLQSAQDNTKSGTPLTSDEKRIREDLIQQTDNFGYLYSDKTFAIVYLKSYDTFQIRLLSADIETSEKNAMNFLKSKGLSQNGICKLPVIYYVNSRLLGSIEKFDAIPVQCQ